MASKETRPVLALAMGDPAGISLELAAKLMADDEARSLADYIVVGDSRAFADLTPSRPSLVRSGW